MKIEIDKEKYLDSGLISVNKHPTEPYLIYNYTPHCQFNKAWDEITMQCRGLIVHQDTGEIIARPFKKFFNYEEFVQTDLSIPKSVPEVYDKRDGSLGILYWGTDGRPWIATRGSFMSDQAIWATEFFRKNANNHSFSRAHTYLYEIIFPANRIVVDYGSYQGLDLLAIIDTETGLDTPVPSSLPLLQDLNSLGKSVQRIPFTSFEELKARNTKNSEGFVLFWRNEDLRLKVKFEDYVRLHKIFTGLSEIGIWEILASGKEIEQVVTEIPDEMHEWVRDVAGSLYIRFFDIERLATQTEMQIKDLPTRKEQAEIILKSTYPAVTFAMLDGKDYKKIIWRMIRPHGERLFRHDIDT